MVQFNGYYGCSFCEIKGEQAKSTGKKKGSKTVFPLNKDFLPKLREEDRTIAQGLLALEKNKTVSFYLLFFLTIFCYSSENQYLRFNLMHPDAPWFETFSLFFIDIYKHFDIYLQFLLKFLFSFSRFLESEVAPF